MNQVLHGQLLDQWGRPIVREMQTQESENLSRIAQSAPNPVASGLTPRKLAGIVRSAYGGDLSAISDLAHELEVKGGHIFTELSKRKRSITRLPWSLSPPANASAQEKKDTEMLEEALLAMPWMDTMIFDTLDGILKGFSCQELQWNRDSSFKIPDKVIWRPQKMFRVNPDDRNELRINDGSMNGLQLRRFGWIQHRSPAISGYIGETSLANILAWPFIFGNYPTRDMLEFLEIYGLPLKLGKYPAGATDPEKKTLLNAIMSIGHNAGGIIPQGMQIDFIQSAQGGSGEFLNVIEWSEKLISKIILGGTLTSQADGATSTNALGNVHENSRIEIRDSDVGMLEPTITRDLILPLWMLNAKSFSDPKRLPRFVIDNSDPEDLSYYVPAITQLVGIGMKIPKKWVHEKFKIPEAVDGEEVLQAPEVQNPYTGFAGLSSKIAALSTQGETRFTPAQNKIEDGINGITAEALNKAIDPIIQPIIEAVQAGGLEAARDLIPELYAEMDNSEMQELLTRAIFIAELLGGENANE